jgi:ribosome-associated protein
MKPPSQPDGDALDAGVSAAAMVLGGISVPSAAIRIQYARSSGPGGQNVNTTSSKAEVWLTISMLPISAAAKGRLRALSGRRITKLGELHLASDVHRTQEGNRRGIFDRVGELIRQALIEPTPRRKTKSSRAAKRKRLEGKRRRGVIKAGRRDRGDD